MEFNCPACQAPHAFPDDQVPAEGIVVACTRCGHHITLNKNGLVAPEPEPAPAPAPVAASDFSPPGPPSFDPEVMDATREAQSPGRVSTPPAAFGQSAPPPSMPPADLSEPGPTVMSTDGSLAAAVEAEVRAVTGEPEPGTEAKAGKAGKAVGAFDSAMAEAIEPETNVPSGLAFPGFKPGESGAWTWRDLPRAFLGLFDTRRVIFATVGFWIAIVLFGLLQWVGGLLGGLWGPLGSIFNVVAWTGFVAAAAIVASILAFVVQETIVEQRATSIKAGIDWTKAHLKSVVGTPVAFAVVISGAWAAGYVLSLLGGIPAAGPILGGLLSPVNTLLALAAGAVGVVFLYSIPLYIPIIHAEQTGPVATLKRLGALFRAHGFRLAVYLLLTLVTIGFAWFVIITPLLAVAARVGAGHAGNPITLLMGTRLGGAPGDAGFLADVGSWLTGIGSAIGPAVLLALVALVYYTAGCIIYAIVSGRQKA